MSNPPLSAGMRNDLADPLDQVLLEGLTPDPFLNHTVYRFFKDPLHADALVAGYVWLSTLGICRDYENAARGDKEEGVLTYDSGSPVWTRGNARAVRRAALAGIRISSEETDVLIAHNLRTQKQADAFIICTTEVFSPEVLSEDFGRHCVEIRNAAQFFRSVTQALAEVFPVLEAVFGRVRYTDRVFSEDGEPPAHLSFIKPPDRYQAQREFRFLWSVDQPAPLAPMGINVPRVSGHCRRVA